MRPRRPPGLPGGAPWWGSTSTTRAGRCSASRSIVGIAAAVLRPASTARYLAASRGVDLNVSTPGPPVISAIECSPLWSRSVTAGPRCPRSRSASPRPFPPGPGSRRQPALTVAVTTAILRLLGATITAREVAAVDPGTRSVRSSAFPCGPLDQRAVIDAPDCWRAAASTAALAARPRWRGHGLT